MLPHDFFDEEDMEAHESIDIEDISTLVNHLRKHEEIKEGLREVDRAIVKSLIQLLEAFPDLFKTSSD